MKRKLMKCISFCFLIMIVTLAGCSSSSSEKEVSQADDAMMDHAESGRMENKSSLESSETDKVEQTKGDQTKDSAKYKAAKQMVIYHADLQLRVKKFDQTVKSLEEKVQKYGGYIAESNVTREGKEQISGSIVIRVPQTYFQAFLHDAEEEAAEVLQRNITGQDVTEEYVDLESRLKSKRVVEERLLTFMKNANKTEDLLKISGDLAVVQEEIETLEGRMKFLENQTSLSTVTITLFENKVIVPDINNDQLNTWEKTKKQFIKSTNMLLAGLSGLIVFLIGNLPILLLLVLIAVVCIYSYKKRKANKHD